MEDTLKSVVRTLVPVVVGLIISGLATAGIELDEASLYPVIDTIFVGGYYTVVRLLESKDTRFGWLLGLPVPPHYTASRDIDVDDA